MKNYKPIRVALFLLPQLFYSIWCYGQSTTVRGVVTDESESPLVGVNVVIQGTNSGTVTDVNGAYQIEASPESTLSFSFVGYNSQNVTVGNQTEINITLVADITQLEDVVIIGYGTQPRQNLTGSVAKLDQEKIELKPVSSIESALQGQVAGVSVVNTGSPGTAPTVRIRGIGSLNFSADPLYVIDGVPVGNLNNFDIKDIESVSILKDAASAAIYGSRAANGVVLIKTKSGKTSEKLSLNIDASYGVQNAWKKLDLLNRDEYIQYGTELLTNAGTRLPYRFENMDEPIYEGATQTYAQTETDWQEEMFRTAPIVQLNVNLSGGNENSRLYTSYGRYSQEGIMLGTDYNRHSFRINSDSKLNKYVTIGENLKASYSEMSRQRVDGGRTLVKHIVNNAPFVPVYNPTNIGGYGGTANTDGSDAPNPVRIAEMDIDQTNIVNLVGNAYAEIRFTNWLKYRSSFGLEYTADRHIIRLPIYEEGYNQRVNNELTDNRFTFYSPVITNQLTFNQLFGKHLINAVAVAEQQKTKKYILNASGDQETNEIDELIGSTGQTLDGTVEYTVLQSYAGRLNYAYDNKYLVNFSIRRDGSSVFAPGKRWGSFPGASAGWVISRESFFENVNIISNLKLKASYGTLGFNGVSAYPWQTVVSTTTTAVFNNNYEDNVGAFFDNLPNKGLEWEITTMSNYGFDLALLDNTITLSAEYFLRETDNLIVNNPLPSSLGYAQDPPTNIGAMKNWGYEISAGYNKRIGDLQFSVDGNISFIDNEVISVSTGLPTIDRGGVTSDYGGSFITRTEKGYPIQGFYGWIVEGLFTQAEIDAFDPENPYQPNAAAGDIKFKDINGLDEDGELTGQPDGIIDEADRDYIGNPLPDFTYGLNLNASYKGFNASVFIQGVQGNEIYNGTKVLTQGMMRLFNADKAVLDAWTPTNTNTDIPRAVNGDPNGNARISDRFVEDGSYMRVKNFQLSYNIPQSTVSNLFKGSVSRINIYITGQNLLTFTKYTGYDPEIGMSKNYSGAENANLLQGVDFGFYPQPRTFIGGINVTF